VPFQLRAAGTGNGGGRFPATVGGAFKTVASTVATTDRVFVTVGSGREQDVSCLHAG